MSIRESYVHTLHACNISYVTQAIVNDFAPLLFLWFMRAYDLKLGQLSYLLVGNFWLQMCVAFACAKLADRLSYRLTLVVGQFCSAAGLVLMTVLPELMPNPLAGLTCAVALYAVGGGVVEAVTAAVTEASAGLGETRAGAREQLMKILRVMLYAHAAARLRENAENELSALLG
jgi:MFS family permease